MKVGSNWLRSAGLAFVLAAALGTMQSPAIAQQYPNQDIRFICAFPAGSGADVLVRYFAEKLRPVVGRTVIVENKVGAGGNIATEYVARAKPDGYTIFVHAATAVAASMHLFKNPPIDVGKAIQIAATINRQPFMVVVDAKSPYKTVGRADRGDEEEGRQGELCLRGADRRDHGRNLQERHRGARRSRCNYKTAPDSLNEILSGKLDYAMHDPVFALAQQREGRLRILAVSTGKRLAASPDLPTMTELGVPMDLTGWWAAMVPAGTPKPVIDQIHKWFVQIVASDDTKKFLNSFGGDPYIKTPEEAQEVFLQDIKNWGDYVRMAKIEPQG